MLLEKKYYVIAFKFLWLITTFSLTGCHKKQPNDVHHHYGEAKSTIEQRIYLPITIRQSHDKDESSNTELEIAPAKIPLKGMRP